MSDTELWNNLTYVQRMEQWLQMRRLLGEVAQFRGEQMHRNIDQDRFHVLLKEIDGVLNQEITVS